MGRFNGVGGPFSVRVERRTLPAPAGVDQHANRRHRNRSKHRILSTTTDGKDSLLIQNDRP